MANPEDSRSGAQALSRKSGAALEPVEPQSGALQTMSSEPEPLEIWVSDPNVGPDSEGIDGFYRTREAAIRGVKRRFGDPYKVTWSEEGTTPNKGVLLRGEFEAVPGYCTTHIAEWFILPVTVEP